MPEVSDRQRRLLIRAATVVAALSIVLVVVNAFMFLRNQSAQADVNSRQQFINESAQFSQLNEALVRSIATAAANNNDEKLRDILAQNGITYTVTPNPPAAGGAPTGAAPAAPPAVAPAGK